MKYEVVTKPEFKVIGISIRTETENNQTALALKELWERFYMDGIADDIPNKVNEDVLSLYIDYEGDYTDPYNTFACCEVKSFDNVPDGMSAKIVPASKYAVISVDGTSPEKVLEAWENIWDSNLKRAYEGDFDVYSEAFLNEKTSTLKIYVSIK